MSESEARHALVNQLVEQSLAQQEQWNKQKCDLITSLGENLKHNHRLDFPKTSESNIHIPHVPERSHKFFLMKSDETGLCDEIEIESASTDNMQVKINYLEKALAASNKQCSVFLLEIEKCRSELEKANSRISYYSKLQDAVASISEEACVVKSRSEIAVQELQTARTERDALLNRLHDAEVEINDAAHDVVTSNTVHQSLWVRVKELEADIRSLSRDWSIKLEESNAANMSLVEDLSIARSECVALNSTISYQVSEIMKLTEKVVMLEAGLHATSTRASAEETLSRSTAMLQLEELKKDHSIVLETNCRLSKTVDELEEIKDYLESDNETVHLLVVDKVVQSISDS